MKPLKLQLPLWASRLMKFFFSNICVSVCQQASPRHLLELLRWKHNHWPNGSLDLVADCLCRKYARAWIFTSCLWPGGFKESTWKETLHEKQTVSYQISQFIAKENMFMVHSSKILKMHQENEIDRIFVLISFTFPWMTVAWNDWNCFCVFVAEGFIPLSHSSCSRS